MALLRYQIFLIYIIAFLSLWISLLKNEEKCISTYYEFVSTTLVQTGAHDAILHNLILYAPFIALLCLALYAVTNVIYGMIQFSDCPDALIELEKQIKEAKFELKKRGISCG